MRLHAEYMRSGRSHAGIVIITQRRWSVDEQARRLSDLLERRTAADMVKEVAFLSARDGS